MSTLLKLRLPQNLGTESNLEVLSQYKLSYTLARQKLITTAISSLRFCVNYGRIGMDERGRRSRLTYAALTVLRQQKMDTTPGRGSSEHFCIYGAEDASAHLRASQQLKSLEVHPEAESSSYRRLCHSDIPAVNSVSSPRVDDDQLENHDDGSQENPIRLKKQSRSIEGKNAAKSRAASRNLSTPEWLLNRRKNEETSKLYGFPSELLLSIFGNADFLTQQMIRQTCSHFADLVASLDLQRAQRPWKPEFSHLQIWPCHGTREQRSEIREQWSALIRRDIRDLCTDCVAFEQSGQLDDSIRRLKKQLWCSDCFSFHSRGLFSSSQRERWFWRRKCIKWEGRLRLCPHVSCGWSQVLDKVHQRESRKRYDRVEDSLIRCPENCHWSGSYNSFWPEKAEEKSQYKLSCRQYRHRSMIDSRPAPETAATWANHVFDIDPNRPLTRHAFREALESLDVGSCGPFLCPHMRIDDVQLLLPLEPGLCSCFSNKFEPGYKVKRHNHAGKKIRAPCICRTEIAADPSRQSITMESYDGGFAHTFQCRCDATYMWRRRGNSIHLEFYTAIFLRFASFSYWIPKLDPHSWNITEDLETRHVYWCPNSECRTNRRWSALYRRMPCLDADKTVRRQTEGAR